MVPPVPLKTGTRTLAPPTGSTCPPGCSWEGSAGDPLCTEGFRTAVRENTEKDQGAAHRISCALRTPARHGAVELIWVTSDKGQGDDNGGVSVVKQWRHGERKGPRAGVRLGASGGAGSNPDCWAHPVRVRRRSLGTRPENSHF